MGEPQVSSNKDSFVSGLFQEPPDGSNRTVLWEEGFEGTPAPVRTLQWLPGTGFHLLVIRVTAQLGRGMQMEPVEMSTSYCCY